MTVRTWDEGQAYNLDCILMLLLDAAKSSGDSWDGGGGGGGVGGSGEGVEGDIEFHAPVRLQAAAALRHTMAPVK